MTAQGTDGPIRVLVLNPKGGCGKTTIATNLASLYARLGRPVSLIDHDPQGSSAHWLAQRSPELPAIHSIPAFKPEAAGVTRAFQFRLPFDTERVIVDTPAGAPNTEVRKLLRLADVVIVPMLASPIDIHAASVFIQRLEREREHRPIALVANRVKSNTLGKAKLKTFVDTLSAPLITTIRDLQLYVQLAEHGQGIYDVFENDYATAEQEAWLHLAKWIDQASQQVSRRPSVEHEAPMFVQTSLPT